MKFLLSVLCLTAFNLQAEEPFTLYFTRHAEKIQTADTDPGLTPTGIERAKKLAEFLSGRNIEIIYSTNYKRTQQTALPLARQSKLAVTPYDPINLRGLVSILLLQKQNALIVGHSNTTPALVSLTGGEAEAIDDADYGKLFAVSVIGESRSTTIHFIEP
ncbi:MAG: phosphoglycerate mutase family protein [bacterium]|nr:histidine phosphatase family protein [Gammaproteobacteria bacterium]HIL95030.1 histidine phosphatase family protein [Pseudomonadales bacterium]